MRCNPPGAAATIARLRLGDRIHRKQRTEDNQSGLRVGRRRAAWIFFRAIAISGFCAWASLTTSAIVYRCSAVNDRDRRQRNEREEREAKKRSHEFFLYGVAFFLN